MIKAAAAATPPAHPAALTLPERAAFISYTLLPIAIGAAGVHAPESRDGVPPELAMSIVRTNTTRADRATVECLATFDLNAQG
jgi:hypothetical protein